jgi:aminopeptidase N
MSHPALLLLLLAPLAAAAVSPGPGVSEALAESRAAHIRNVRYRLHFVIPESKTEAIGGEETVSFELDAPQDVVLDFERPLDHIPMIDKPYEYVDGHIVIPASATKAGSNAVHILFRAGDESLNRNDEFLYTLFVPARAHFAFPCFDQPSLKARYSLSLEIPAGWKAVANGAAAEPGNTVRFAETEPLPIYLFAFAAGKFQVETAERNGRTFRMFHRETDAAKVARNRDAIFDLHARALSWLEEYTAIKYPWGKFDFVLIPSFQFGGMEHAGAILYNASGLLLDATATQNQLLGRASVIAHETAHMWFGDLVTMRWFNDVWMKEVMANFMAAKIVNPSFPEINHDLRFLLQHYPTAYEVDRTAGANPIRQRLANLDEAGSLYGAIIYDKAPVVMRQLETIMGERGFRDGMREYLKNYSFGNATWVDLVNLLEQRNPGQVVKWSHAWVEERGRPEITTAGATLTQRDPLGRGLIWPQRLQVTIGYADRVEQKEVAMNGPEAAIPLAKERPLYVIPNGGGIGYGLFRLDDATLRYLLAHIEEIADPLTRGSAWVDLWENLLDGRVAAGPFMETALRAVPREADEQNTQRILSYMVRYFWMGARTPEIETVLRAGLAKAPTASRKSAWFNAFRDVVLSPEGLAWLERVWRRDEKVEGLTFAETDEIEMAMHLALRGVAKSQEILAAQLERTKNPERKARFAFVMPALSQDPALRERLFASFRDRKNREHEPWVLEAERFLNHPLREPESRRYVRPALELLPEIQRTGDIFFPKRWADATLHVHRSP